MVQSKSPKQNDIANPEIIYNASFDLRFMNVSWKTFVEGGGV